MMFNQKVIDMQSVSSDSSERRKTHITTMRLEDQKTRGERFFSSLHLILCLVVFASGFTMIVTSVYGVVKAAQLSQSGVLIPFILSLVMGCVMVGGSFLGISGEYYTNNQLLLGIYSDKRRHPHTIFVNKLPFFLVAITSIVLNVTVVVLSIRGAYGSSLDEEELWFDMQKTSRLPIYVYMLISLGVQVLWCLNGLMAMFMKVDRQYVAYYSSMYPKKSEISVCNQETQFSSDELRFGRSLDSERTPVMESIRLTSPSPPLPDPLPHLSRPRPSVSSNSSSRTVNPVHIRKQSLKSSGEMHPVLSSEASYESHQYSDNSGRMYRRPSGSSPTLINQLHKHGAPVRNNTPDINIVKDHLDRQYHQQQQADYRGDGTVTVPTTPTSYEIPASLRRDYAAYQRFQF